MGVFKTYDIRGVFGQGLDTNIAYLIGRSFARYTGYARVMMAHDSRIHSTELYRSFINGLITEGCEVLGIGLTSTPALHYLQIKGKFDGAVMVTASHNPAQYHGFKLFDTRGGSISYGKGLEKIEAQVLRLSDNPPGSSDRTERAGKAGRGERITPTGNQGDYREEDRIQDYIDFLVSAVRGGRIGKRVVIDVSNGSSGRIFRLLSESLGLDAILINTEPNGTFPNHSPNPLEETSRKQIAEKVRETGADLGAVLDGDGDRIIFTDERGRALENYFVSSLIAEELLASFPGSSIVYDLIASRVLPERIRELGGKAIVSRVGYTFIYDRMVDSGALFGSETSGHVYFRVSDSYYTESAAYALIVLLMLLQRKGAKLSELVEPLRRRYAQAPETNLAVVDKEGAMRMVEQSLPGAKIDRLDGISFSFPDYWFNLRPSNTEPLLRLRLEAVNSSTAERRMNEILAIIRRGGKV